MRTFTLLYLAISASMVLAAPRPVPVAEDSEIIRIVENESSEPESPRELGPDAGTPTPPKEPSTSEQVSQALNELNQNYTPTKRGLEKRVIVVPPGYYCKFAGLNGATEHPSYRTYKTLPSEDAQACTSFCDSKPGCLFANMYQEHTDTGILYKCSLYNQQSGLESATNIGQWRNNFHVTISDSYGFAKGVNPEVPGFIYQKVGGAINGKKANPTDADPYMGYSSIETSDPVLCAAICEQKTAYNSRHIDSTGTYRACGFYNFYILVKNNVDFKTICSFYIIPFDDSFAVNHGYSSNGDVYTIRESITYTRITQQGSGGIVTVPPTPTP